MKWQLSKKYFCGFVLFCLFLLPVFSAVGSMKNTESEETVNSQQPNLKLNLNLQNLNLQSFNPNMTLFCSLPENNESSLIQSATSSTNLSQSLQSMKTNLEILTQQLQILKEQSKESQKTSQRYKELWNQAEQKVNELTETNNSLIAALESNKEDTSVIEQLFGELYSDYQNLVLAKESLELRVKAQKKVKQTAYITSGAVTVTGLGLWFCGDAIDNQAMKDIGIGLTFGGGIPLLSISITDLISRFR